MKNLSNSNSTITLEHPLHSVHSHWYDVTYSRSSRLSPAHVGWQDASHFEHRRSFSGFPVFRLRFLSPWHSLHVAPGIKASRKMEGTVRMACNNAYLWFFKKLYQLELLASRLESLPLCPLPSRPQSLRSRSHCFHLSCRSVSLIRNLSRNPNRQTAISAKKWMIGGHLFDKATQTSWLMIS